MVEPPVVPVVPVATAVVIAPALRVAVVETDGRLMDEPETTETGSDKELVFPLSVACLSRSALTMVGTAAFTRPVI